MKAESFKSAFDKLAAVVGLDKAQEFLQAKLAQMNAARAAAPTERKWRIGYSAKSPASRRRSSRITPRTDYVARGHGSLHELDARVSALIAEGHPTPSRVARQELRA